MKNITEPSYKQIKATELLQKIRLESNYNDEEICEFIGISKPTLYKRLRLQNWKVGEIFAINNIRLS